MDTRGPCRAAQLCRASLALREQVVDALIDLTDAACHSLEPMCRPMWWGGHKTSIRIRIPHAPRFFFFFYMFNSSRSKTNERGA